MMDRNDGMYTTQVRPGERGARPESGALVHVARSSIVARARFVVVDNNATQFPEGTRIASRNRDGPNDRLY